MELEQTTVKELKLLDSAAREQPVEADILLPEYYPPVGRILKCFVSPSEEAVAFADGRVSVAGAAAVRLLYTDDANQVFCYETETKYTKILPTEVRGTQAAVRVTQDVRTLNCRALGPKRVEVRASIAVKAELLGIAETAAITAAGDHWQLRAETADCCEPVCVYCREFTQTASERRDAGGRRLRTVIAAWAVPSPEQTDTVANKLMVRGKSSVTVVCADEDGGVGSYELSLPFSEVLDCYGVGDHTAVSVTPLQCRAEVSLPEGADNTFDVTVRTQLLVLATQNRALTCVSDAYSLSGEAECRFAELSPARSFSQSVSEERVAAELEAYEDGGFSVKSVFVSDVSCAAADGADKGGVEGSLCFNVLIADSENRLSLLTKTAAFSCPPPESARCVACGVSVKNPAGETLPGGKIGLSCVLSCHLLTQTGERVRVLTEVREGEGVAARQERAVVYFAEKGESLWDIAKENRTSVANIKAYNSLSSEVLEEDTRLVFACF